MKTLFSLKDIASLAFFRFAFGIIMCWEVCRYFKYNWIERYWIDANFTFTYNFFHWIKPLPEYGLHIAFLFLGVLAIFIALGLFYRISTTLFFIGFTYIFLLDKTNYLNHFYLISLLSFLLIFLPAHKNYSLDSLINPKIKTNTIPYWAILALQLQIGIAYFYGGLAKLNFDWLAGEPMRMWLSSKTDFWIIGKYFTSEVMIYFFVIGGLLLDLLIVPLLVWRKTRIYAYVIIVIFHLLNSQLFRIGIFPWFMIAATTIFFESDWCKKFLNKIFKNRFEVEENEKHFNFNKTIKYAFCVYFLFQLTIPLRHYFIPGNVNWTERGHRFAWHMKLRTKKGKVKFRVVNNSTKKVYSENPKDFLLSRQASKMSGRPDMIFQYAQLLKVKYRRKGIKDVSIFVDAKARLNGRPYQTLIDPNYDLTKQKYFNEYTVDWILPLTLPLKNSN